MQGTRSRVSSLVSVINVEVAKTNTSFLTYVSFSSEDTYLNNSLFSYSGSNQLARGLFPLSLGWR